MQLAFGQNKNYTGAPVPVIAGCSHPPPVSRNCFAVSFIIDDSQHYHNRLTNQVCQL